MPVSGTSTGGSMCAERALTRCFGPDDSRFTIALSPDSSDSNVCGWTMKALPLSDVKCVLGNATARLELAWKADLGECSHNNGVCT